MIKQLIWICTSVLFLSACGDNIKHYQTTEQAKQALQKLNHFLRPSADSSSVITKSQWPFTDAYLQKRHEIYQAMQTLELVSDDQNLLNYLIIAERFPERYFNWPVYIPVLKNMLERNKQQDISADIEHWIRFTQQQLISANDSKLRLNSIELKALQMQVVTNLDTDNLPASIKSALTEFNDYLSSYIPRGSVGLQGLPNGSDWYQSKLNYFSGVAKPPINWLVEVQAQLKQTEQQKYSFNHAMNHQYSLLEQRFASSKEQVAGFDWAQNYLNLRSYALQKGTDLTVAERTFWLAMMETDLGIHYHAWTIQQAQVNLQKRLKMTPDQVGYLVADIIYYPAQSFSFSSVLITP